MAFENPIRRLKILFALGTLRNTPLCKRSVVMSRKKRSTMFGQDAEVGVK